MSVDIAAPRSWLFVPGDRSDRFDKAVAAGADAVILDLEDAVAPDKRAQASKAVTEWLRQREAGGPVQHWIRVSDPNTVSDQFLAIAQLPAFDGFVLPKVESADQVRRWPYPVMAQIETASGVLAAVSIAADGGEHLRSLTLGAEDLSLSLRCQPDAAGMTGSAQQLVLASRAAGRAVYACPGSIAQFRDLDAWQAILDLGKGLGSDGQLCIHPNQVAPVNATFSPSAQAIEKAKRIVETFDLAMEKGSAAVQLDGEMLDAPVVARARLLLARR